MAADSRIHHVAPPPRSVTAWVAATMRGRSATRSFSACATPWSTARSGFHRASTSPSKIPKGTASTMRAASSSAVRTPHQLTAARCTA